MMTAEQLETIAVLRSLNYPYSFIANELKLSMNTVKSICRRKGYKAFGNRKTKSEKATAPICKCCHKPLSEGMRSDAKFCSSYCRTKWRRQNFRIIEK